MDNVLVEAIDLLNHLPEKGVEKALEYMKELKKRVRKRKNSVFRHTITAMKKCRTRRAQEWQSCLFVPFL